MTLFSHDFDKKRLVKDMLKQCFEGACLLLLPLFLWCHNPVKLQENYMMQPTL
jgi:hypothetical protein